MYYHRTDFEIEHRCLRIDTQIELIFLDAILKALEKFNSRNNQLLDKQSNADDNPF